MPPNALDIPAAGGTLRFRKGHGWATYDPHPVPGALTQLRFGEAGDGRIFVAELHVAAHGATTPEVTGTVLRSIPLGSIEMTVNGPSVRDRVLAHIRSDGPDYNAADFGPKRRTFGELVDESTKHPDRPSRRLKIPKQRIRPDEFYAHVAELYTWLAGPGGSRKPARDIANDNDVPASTVHRWLREARARGLLGPGQRGGPTSERNRDE